MLKVKNIDEVFKNHVNPIKDACPVVGVQKKRALLGGPWRSLR